MFLILIYICACFCLGTGLFTKTDGSDNTSVDLTAEDQASTNVSLATSTFKIQVTEAFLQNITEPTSTIKSAVDSIETNATLTTHTTSVTSTKFPSVTGTINMTTSSGVMNLQFLQIMETIPL